MILDRLSTAAPQTSPDFGDAARIYAQLLGYPYDRAQALDTEEQMVVASMMQESSHAFAIREITDHDIVGVAVVDVRDPYAWLEAFVVDERVGSIGLGACALGLIERFARQQGCESLKLKPTKRARPFYIRAGYQIMAAVVQRCLFLKKHSRLLASSRRS